MKIEECIHVLKYNHDMCMFNPTTGENEPMNKDCEELAKAIEFAIPLLEHLIPITPIVKMVDSDGYWAEYSCPVCKRNLTGTEKICSCGQHIEYQFK